MAYTGTGTEQDPYLVSSFADFVECAGKNNAYVKVVSDIDDSQNGTNTSYNSSISIKAKKIYADTLTVISGFTISSNYFLQYTGSTKCTFSHIGFEAGFTPSSGSMIMGNSITHMIFQHCRIRMTISAPPKCKLFVNSDFTDCEIHVSYDGSFYAYPSVIAQECVFLCCAIEIRNYYSTNPVIMLDSGTTSLQYCTFYFTASVRAVNTSGSWYLFGANGSTFRNIFIMNLSYDGFVSDTLTSCKIYGTNMLADSSTKGKFDISFDDASGNNYLLTSEQLKSETYLTQTGFITGQEEMPWRFDNAFYGYPHTTNLTDNPLNLMYGSVPVRKAYLGTLLIWERGGINKIFPGGSENS